MDEPFKQAQADTRGDSVLATAVAIWRDVAVGLLFYALTTLIVVIALRQPSQRNAQPGEGKPPETAGAPFYWDGEHYLEIAEKGYTYAPKSLSSVAYFPLYPLSGRWLARCTGIPLRSAMIVVAHCFLAGAFVFLSIYARGRALAGPSIAARYAVLAFGVFPPTFFFRAAYTESSFLFLAVLAMLAMQRRWRPIFVAGIVGLATATRPVGVALVPVFCLYVWKTSPIWRVILARCLLVPVAMSGLLAYMTFQYFAFGDALAFAKTQDVWRFRPHSSAADKAIALACQEPLWTAYDSRSIAYWQRLEPNVSAEVNLAFANPVYFVLAVGLVIVGAGKRWLDLRETLLSALLILIPYVTRAYEMCMLSEGRFVAAAFPIYLVMGHILARLPAPYAALLIGLFVLFLAIYSSQFATGYMLI